MKAALDSGLGMIALLARCASAPRPVLYPNPRYKQVGDAGSLGASHPAAGPPPAPAQSDSGLSVAYARWTPPG